MSFTKLSYDDCSYKAELATNVNQLSYHMDPNKFYRNDICRHELGIVGGVAVSHVNANLVDLESNLFGIDREASKCPAMKYVPEEYRATGADFYRPVQTNEVDTHMRHLPACQMFATPGVPRPPAVKPYSCQK